MRRYSKPSTFVMHLLSPTTSGGLELRPSFKLYPPLPGMSMHRKEGTERKRLELSQELFPSARLRGERIGLRRIDLGLFGLRLLDHRWLEVFLGRALTGVVSSL